MIPDAICRRTPSRSRRLQSIGKRHFRQRQPELMTNRVRQIVLVAEPLLVPPGQQTGARRAANGRRRICVREPHAIRADRIDVWSWKLFAAMHTDVAVAEIVGHNEHDIRPSRTALSLSKARFAIRARLREGRRHLQHGDQTDDGAADGDGHGGEVYRSGRPVAVAI